MTVINYLHTTIAAFAGDKDSSLSYICDGKKYFFLIGEDVSPTMWGTALPDWEGVTFEPLFTLAVEDDNILRHREEWLSRKAAFHQECFLDEIGDPTLHLDRIAYYCEMLDRVRETAQLVLV